MNLQIVLNTQKNPYLNQATSKKYLPNFPTQKNPGIKNFKPKKILQSSPSLEIRSIPPLGIEQVYIRFSFLLMLGLHSERSLTSCQAARLLKINFSNRPKA